MDPYLKLALEPALPYNTTIDVGTLTGGAQGNSGADFIFPNNAFCKFDGGHQLNFEVIGSPSSQGNFYLGDQGGVNAGDINYGSGPARGGGVQFGMSYQFAASAVGVGLRFNLPAGQDLSSFYFVGQAQDAGAWVVTATHLDRSFATQTLALPNASGSTNACFRLDYTGMVGSKVRVEILKTNAARVSAIGIVCAYKPIPVPPVLPQAFFLGLV